MDSKTYLKESARTASSQLHTDIVDIAMLEHTLKEAIQVGAMVDAVKKALFYGKGIPAGTGVELFKGEPSELNGQSVTPDVLHGALGLFTESVEILEAVLAAMRNGSFDQVNALEELGDAEWYMAMLYRSLGSTPGHAKSVNIHKLRKRYPDKFESEQAINRDTDAERSILENGFVNTNKRPNALQVDLL